MSEDSERERLKRLEERIARLRQPEEPPKTEDHYSQAQLAWRMVTELVAGLGLGFCIGLGLDAVFGTRPFLMVLFIFFGLAAGIRTMMRTAAEVGRRGPAQPDTGHERPARPGADETQAGTPADRQGD